MMADSLGGGPPHCGVGWQVEPVLKVVVSWFHSIWPSSRPLHSSIEIAGGSCMTARRFLAAGTPWLFVSARSLLLIGAETLSASRSLGFVGGHSWGECHGSP